MSEVSVTAFVRHAFKFTTVISTCFFSSAVMAPIKKNLTEVSQRQKRRRLNDKQLIVCRKYESNDKKQTVESISSNLKFDEPPVSNEKENNSSHSTSGSDTNIVASENRVVNNLLSDTEVICANDSDVVSVTENIPVCVNNANYNIEDPGHQIKIILQKWINTEKNVSHGSVDRLLSLFNPVFPNVPKSVKSLIVDRKEYEIEDMGNGEYVHFPNWKENLDKSLVANNISNNKVIHLCFNCDGIPLFNNTNKYTAYPILASVLELPSKIFCIGIYCINKFEYKDIPPIDRYLYHFTEDLKELFYGTNSESTYKYEIGAFVCDAPMRAYLKGIISHSGYSCCERCQQRGTYHCNAVVYPEVGCLPRTDLEFTQRKDKNHHKLLEPSCLEMLPLKMVSVFVLDHMHLCFLGVTKRLITRLISSKSKEKKVNIGTSSKNELDKKLNKYNAYIPSDFVRKLEGGVKTILKWKASQYRLFTLYIGMVLFNHSKVVSKEIYQHFLYYCIAMRILLSNNQCGNLETVQHLLMLFVNQAKEIYGLSFMSYNVHNLLHLIDDYKQFGNLNNISAFPYESYLGGHIKGAVRAGFKPLHQIAVHISSTNITMQQAEVVHVENIVKHSIKCNHVPQFEKCYKKISISKFIIKPSCLSISDCCVQLKTGQIGLVQAIHKNEENNISLTIKLYEKVIEYFDEPVKSSMVGVFKVDNCRTTITVVPSDIFCKMVRLPFKRQYIVCVLLHTVI